MKLGRIFTGLVVPVFFLAGCATNVSTLTPDLSMCRGNNNPESTKSVYIKSVTDGREFSDKARQAYMPTWSNDGSYEEARAVGRKRNGFGKAMGGLVLPEGMPATAVVKQTLTQALVDNGYKVVEKESDVTSDTKVLDVKMPTFWSWMNPGFWNIRLTTDIEAEVSGYQEETVRVKGKYGEGFQLGTESNWLEVLNAAIRKFYEDAKNKLK